MNKYSVFIVSVFFVLLAFAGFAAGDDRGDRLCTYKHENFKGHEKCYRPGDEVSDLKDAEISSIRVYGHARARYMKSAISVDVRWSSAQTFRI